MSDHTLEIRAPGKPGGISYNADTDTITAILDTGGSRTASASMTPKQVQVVGEPMVHKNPIHWMVDTVRGMSFVGPAKIAWLEDHFYSWVDRYRRVEHSIAPDNTASEIANEMEVGPEVADDTVQIPGWPPQPLKPLLGSPIAGEGVYRLVNDAFIAKNPGAPSPFAETFLRADPKRPYVRAYLVTWDPRQIAINMVAGTVEPKSATGQVGQGQIPRTEGVIDHVAAGFNGGWQAIHGEFGMMGDGIVYLEPKPWAATVARLKDGSTGFGTWPQDTKTIPPEFQSYRQNLTALVQDGKINPFERGYWGLAPHGAAEKNFIARSGLCLTKDNFVTYIYGQNLSAETLAETMIRRPLYLRHGA